MGKRYAIFYCIGAVASAFGGILAFGLTQMEGVAGYGGWRWIFIIEGIVSVQTSLGNDVALFTRAPTNRLTRPQITCLIAGLGFLFLLSFPDSKSSKSLKFLTEDERRVIIARVNRDRGDATLEAFSWKKFLRPAADIRIWGYALSKLLVSHHMCK